MSMIHLFCLSALMLNKVLNKLNSFHKNLWFTLDTFSDQEVHFFISLNSVYNVFKLYTSALKDCMGKIIVF